MTTMTTTTVAEIGGSIGASRASCIISTDVKPCIFFYGVIKGKEKRVSNISAWVIGFILLFPVRYGRRRDYFRRTDIKTAN